MSEFQQRPITPQGGVATQPQSSTTSPQSSGPSTIQPGSPGQTPGQPITKRQEVCRVAADLFRQSPDWVTFFREVLGVEGVARRVFSIPEEMEAFEQTAEYAEIQGMVAKLREKSRSQTESNEPTRVITVHFQAASNHR
jgi:hypothetical protein